MAHLHTSGMVLPSKTLSCNTGPPFQIFVVVRQNWGNYTLSPHIKYQKHISIKFKKMINWHYKDKLFFRKRYWQEKEKLYRLGENTNHISNKRFISKIYEELSNQQYTHTHTHTHTNLHFLSGQNIWTNTSPKKTYRRRTHNKHMKKFQTY